MPLPIGSPLGKAELEELVCAARGGDQHAVQRLLIPHLKMMNGLAHRLVGAADREEVVQESIYQALRSLRRIVHADSLGTWFGQIVVRVVLKHRRKRRLLARLGLGAAPVIEVEAVASTDAPAEVLVELREIYKAIENLPERVRQTIVLRRIEGLSLRETAALMSASSASVKRWTAVAERVLLGLEANHE